MNDFFNFENCCNVVQFPSKPELIPIINGTKMREVTKIMFFQQMAKMLRAKTQMEGWILRSEIQGLLSALMAETIIDIPLCDKLSKLVAKEWEDYRITLPE